MPAQAKEAGASRFCMGAAWRSPKDKDLDAVCAMVEGVKALGLESCVTLGMLTGAAGAAAEAGGAGLLQPQSRHLARILPPYHQYTDLSGPPRHAGPCARGRHQCLLRRHCRHGRKRGRPRRHDPCAGHPARASPIACRSTPWCGGGHARRPGPRRWTRSILSAPSRWPASPCPLPWCGCRRGAKSMSAETQALCFLAGANSIFYGEKLLTTAQPGSRRRQGAVRPAGPEAHAAKPATTKP